MERNDGRKRTAMKFNRRKGESVLIGDTLVTVVSVGRGSKGKRATILVQAPADVPVRKGE